MQKATPVVAVVCVEILNWKPKRETQTQYTRRTDNGIQLAMGEGDNQRQEETIRQSPAGEQAQKTLTGEEHTQNITGFK